MHISLMKIPSGWANADKQAEELHGKTKMGNIIHSDFKKMRNPKFHAKYFALLNIGFDNWSPKAIDTKYGVPEKNFERFRKDTTILAGFYDVTFRLDGSTRIEAKSISFANMSEDEFEDLYSKTIDVLLKYVYDKDMTKEEIDNIVAKYLEFA